MLTEPGGPFINVDKLDLRKYATRPALAKVSCLPPNGRAAEVAAVRCCVITYCIMITTLGRRSSWQRLRRVCGRVEGPLLLIGAGAVVHAEYKDWWWKARLGKCYFQVLRVCCVACC